MGCPARAEEAGSANRRRWWLFSDGGKGDRYVDQIDPPLRELGPPGAVDPNSDAEIYWTVLSESA